MTCIETDRKLASSMQTFLWTRGTEIRSLCKRVDGL